MHRSECTREPSALTPDDVAPSLRTTGSSTRAQAPALDLSCLPSGDDDTRLHRARKLEALGQLTGTVAHDFNNLLTIIGGYCAEALDVAEPASDLYPCLEGIAEATRRAAALSSKLLAYSREQTPAMLLVDMSDFVADLRDLLNGLVGDRISIVLQKASVPCPVRVERTGLEQVIMNLAANARDAMPGGGVLTVAVSRVLPTDACFGDAPEVPAADYVTLAISDTGIGMSPQTLAHAFEPFFTTKGEGKGTGLGLSSVQWIVKQHGGFVTCRSSLGSGTSFTMFFPSAGPGSIG